MIDSRETPIWKRVLTLALPTLAQQGLFFFIQHYDQWLAGREQFSPEHRAALTTANYLYWFYSSYSVLVSSGATALVGRLIGAQDFSLARRAAAQAILLAIAFGLVASIVAFLGLPSLLTALQLQPHTADIAMAYLTPLACILVLQTVETGGIACLVGAGNTWIGPIVLGGVAAVNIPVAWGLSGGFGPSLDYGFTGIALGTSISHALGGLAVLIILSRGLSGLKLNLKELVPDWPLLVRLLRVSVPAAIDSLSTAACQMIFFSIVARLGDAAISAHGIALRWEALGYLAGGGFAPTAMALVSQSLGAKRPDRAASGGWVAYGLGCAVMCCMGVIFYLFARPMCSFYTSNPAEIEMATSALKLIAFAMPAVASWIILTASLRAAGDTRVPVAITWIGFLGVRLPLAWFLTQPSAGFGLYGAWIAMVADLWLRGLLFAWRFASGRWKTIRV